MNVLRTLTIQPNKKENEAKVSTKQGHVLLYFLKNMIVIIRIHLQQHPLAI